MEGAGKNGKTSESDQGVLVIRRVHDFPSYLGTQPAVARVYFARFQRAPEGSDHSTTQDSHNVV